MELDSRLAFFSTAVLLFASPLASAQESVSTAARPPVTIKQSTVHYSVNADGLYVETDHFEISGSNAAAARSQSEQGINFSETLDDVEVTEAYTLKADGRKLSVAPSAIYTQAAPQVPRVAMFSDLKRRVIVFPDVSANDTVVYTTVKRAKKAVFQGHFIDFEFYPSSLPWEQVEGTIEAPKALPLHVDARGITFERKEAGDEVVYHWRFAAPAQEDPPGTMTSVMDRAPALFFSSFPDYDAFSRAYYELVAPALAPTADIRALATKITNGIADRRQQAQALYDWVSHHIRYVGIEFGRGGVIPRKPDEIVATGYGDCKDHTVLLGALLKAQRIESRIALLNADTSYSVSKVPSLAQINHAITWLPEFDLYVDSTQGVASFGTLPFDEYSKPVIIVDSSGTALRRTPAASPQSTSAQLKTTARLSNDGTVSGETVTTATGPFAVALRKIGDTIEQAGVERAAGLILQHAGLAGSGTFQVPGDAPLTEPVSISARFTLQPRASYLGGMPSPMPDGIRLLGYTGDRLLGPLLGSAGAVGDIPCFSGRSSEELTLELPSGTHVAPLPADVEVKTANLTFRAHWSQSGQMVKVTRTFESHVDQPVCGGEFRRQTSAAFARIAASYLAEISIVRD